ncbi:MAG: site-specific DNA-methyltransferase, partial [Dehalococcoidia bacterium]
LFGHDNFRNEIVWYYANKLPTGGSLFDRHHDVLLWYSKTKDWVFNEVRVEAEFKGTQLQTRKIGGKRVPILDPETGKQVRKASSDKPCGDVWRINMIHPQSPERLGYPTQKPEELMERIVASASNAGDVVADFFVGGGTTPAVAQRLGRRWLACDQSRVAVAITADRVSRQAEQPILGQVTPDFTYEHWGIYDASRLAQTPVDHFREFVLRAFGAVPDDSLPGINGHKGAVPVWVGAADQRSQVTAKDVQDFANAVRKTVRYQQDNLRDGIMLAWAFRPDAVEAAQRLREMEATDLNFIKLDLVRIDSDQFREHVHSLSTDRADYTTFLTFVQPPKVEVGWRNVSGRTYKFDVSETIVLNAGAKIINVQWDFDYGDHFTSTQGYSFVRTAKKEPALQVDYTFPALGRYHIACKVQDDAGGEGIWAGDVEVS